MTVEGLGREASLSRSAYICVSPHGSPIPSTIRHTADDSWRVLLASLTDPDILIENGWTVHRVSYWVEEVAG